MSEERLTGIERNLQALQGDVGGLRSDQAQMRVELETQIAEALAVTNLAASSHTSQLIDHETRIEKLEAR